MPVVTERLFTEEEYLKLEEKSKERHEFIDGTIRTMTGTTEEHNDIVLNLATKLLPLARALGCRVRTENLKLKLPIGSKQRYYYPDVVVVCGPRMLLNPCLVTI
jgi:Uma2 family endonuclease